jgi:hypothetical protein
MTHDQNGRESTRAALALAGIRLLATFVGAVPILMWRDLMDVKLPKYSIVFVIMLFGFAVFSIGGGIHWLFGISVDKEPEEKRATDSPDQSLLDLTTDIGATSITSVVCDYCGAGGFGGDTLRLSSISSRIVKMSVYKAAKVAKMTAHQ